MSNDQVVNRAANTTILGAEELSEQEKSGFHDLLQEWCDSRPVSGTGAQAIPDKMRDLFKEKVFFAWNSDDKMIAMPALNVKKPNETSGAVGYFTKNLPVTPSKRKQGQDFQTNLHRMTNASAYLNVSFEANSQGKDFKACWKDEDGLTVSAEFVRVKDGYTKTKAIEAAIVNWDICERFRVDEYNSELIISLARMRTVRFAKDGTDHLPHIPHELRVNNRTLKCQLISDDFEEHYNMVKAVDNGLKARQIGRRHHVII